MRNLDKDSDRVHDVDSPSSFPRTRTNEMVVPACAGGTGRRFTQFETLAHSNLKHPSLQTFRPAGKNALPASPSIQIVQVRFSQHIAHTNVQDGHSCRASDHRCAPALEVFEGAARLTGGRSAAAVNTGSALSGAGRNIDLDPDGGVEERRAAAQRPGDQARRSVRDSRPPAAGRRDQVSRAVFEHTRVCYMSGHLFSGEHSPSV